MPCPAGPIPGDAAAAPSALMKAAPSPMTKSATASPEDGTQHKISNAAIHAPLAASTSEVKATQTTNTTRETSSLQALHCLQHMCKQHLQETLLCDLALCDTELSGLNLV